MTDGGGRRPLRSFVSELAKGKRIIRFTVRMTEEERDKLERDAEQEGLSPSSFIRRLLKLGDIWLARKKAKAADNAAEDAGPPSSGASR